MSTVSTRVEPAGQFDVPEQQRGTPMRSTSRQSGAQAVAQSIASKILILVLNAGTGIITARALMPEGRGQLAAMCLWSQFLAQATSLGVPTSLIYFIRRHRENRSDLIVQGLMMSMALGIAAAICGAFFLPYWLHQYSPLAIRYAQWFLIITPICSITFAGRAVLEASGSFSTSNAVQTLTPFFTLLALVGFLFAHQLTPYTAGFAYIAAALPTFWLMFRRVRPLVSRWSAPRLAVMRLLLGYGIRSYGIDLLGTLALQVDQVLVVSLLAPPAMGAYVVVLSLSRMLNLFQNSVVMVLFPKAAGHAEETVLALTGRSMRISTLITLVASITVAVLGPVLLRVLYGREYVAGLASLRILLVEVTISGAVYILAQAFMALGRPGIVTVLQAIGLGLSVPLMLWLIPIWGIQGAAVSLLISTTVRFAFIYFGFPIFLKTHPPRLFPERRDFDLLPALFRHHRTEIER